jgi:hypothetical protein
MGKLLSGNAPLRGRSGLELLVRPLDHRLAAEFWNLADPRLALMVNSIVGGTPAYRREFARGDSPADMEDFDSWVVRTVLNPETPLFREARYLLAERATKGARPEGHAGQPFPPASARLRRVNGDLPDGCVNSVP